jgi:hypothetical protein
MLFIVLKALIAQGQTEGLREKIDVFYAYGRLTEAEYLELISLLESGAS